MIMNLAEIKETCEDFEEFCKCKGWHLDSVTHDLGYLQQVLTVKEAIRFGIIKEEK